MFPALVQVLDSPRLGTIAVFADGMVAQYNPVKNAWQAMEPSLDYEALFCTTTKRERATDTLDLTLAPDVQVDD